MSDLTLAVGSVPGFEEEDGVGFRRGVFGRLLDLQLGAVFGDQAAPVADAGVGEQGVGLGAEADVEG